MAQTSVTSLVAGTTLAASDVLAWVDISDTTQSASGSLKKITMTNFFGTIPVKIVSTVNITDSSSIATFSGTGVGGLINLKLAHNPASGNAQANIRFSAKQGARTGAVFIIGAQDDGVSTFLQIYDEVAGADILEVFTTGEWTFHDAVVSGFTSLETDAFRLEAQAAASVSTITSITTVATQGGCMALVNGNSGGNIFADLVFYSLSTAAALSSQTVSGAPAARTYTASAGILQLAMASGTYSVTTNQLSGL